MVQFNGKMYDDRHGGPFDRGAADSYYNRPRSPHYFSGATHQSPEIVVTEGSPAYEAYMAGYDWNKEMGSRKVWA